MTRSLSRSRSRRITYQWQRQRQHPYPYPRKARPTGSAGYAIVPGRSSGRAAHFAQWRYRALHGKRDSERLFRF